MKEASAEGFRTKHQDTLRALRSGQKLASDPGNEIDVAIMSEFFGTKTSFLILDGGCGTGRSSIGLAKLGHSVICIDAVPEAVKLSKLLYREAGAGGDFVVGDIRYLPFLNQTFDTVFSGGVLEHFQHADDPIKEYGRVLKKESGVLAASLPNLFSGFALFEHILNPVRFFYWLDKEKRVIHREKLYTRNEAVKTVERNGLQVVKLVPFRLDMSLPQFLPSKLYKWMRKNQPIHKMFYDLARIFPRFCIGFSWFFIFAKKSSS